MTNQYLYGNETVMKIPKDVIDSKLVAIERRINHVMSFDYSIRDNELKGKLLNARDFWNNMLTEEGY